jgi:hypothetical protein
MSGVLGMKWHREYRNPETARRDFASGKYAVGILTGESGLVDDDLDVDDEGNPAGEWSLENLAEGDWDKLPATFTLDSPSGGKHLVWEAPPGREFKTCAGQVAEHFDVRGWGGLFVLWDPHRMYRVLDDRDPVVMPSWLAELHPEPGSVSLNGRAGRAGRAVAVGIPHVHVRAWLLKYGGGEPCELMAETRDLWLRKAVDGGVIHDA